MNKLDILVDMGHPVCKNLGQQEFGEKTREVFASGKETFLNSKCCGDDVGANMSLSLSHFPFCSVSGV